jgi:D-threo-aldose 1-dehydrogenase
MNGIPKRRVGQTQLEVPELGFGGASLGNLFVPIPETEVRSTLDAAWDAGMRFFDTAPYYGFGLSERRIGDFLRTKARSDYVLSTKVGMLIKAAPLADTATVREGFATPLPFEHVYDFSYGGIMRSYEDSQQRLGLARVDILLIHDIGRASHSARNEAHWKDLFGGGYRALDELRSRGEISAVGLGVNEWEVCVDAMREGQFNCFLLAGRYTLLEQDALDVFMPACRDHGAAVIVGGVYNSGILASGTRTDGVIYHNYEPARPEVIERVRRMEAICDQFSVPLAAAALQFALAQPQTCTVIPGLPSASRVKLSRSLYARPIPPEFWQALKAAELIRRDAPVPE